jgi:hypothetical protein
MCACSPRTWEAEVRGSLEPGVGDLPRLRPVSKTSPLNYRVWRTSGLLNMWKFLEGGVLREEACSLLPTSHILPYASFPLGHSFVCSVTSFIITV